MRDLRLRSFFCLSGKFAEFAIEEKGDDRSAFLLSPFSFDILVKTGVFKCDVSFYYFSTSTQIKLLNRSSPFWPNRFVTTVAGVAIRPKKTPAASSGFRAAAGMMAGTT